MQGAKRQGRGKARVELKYWEATVSRTLFIGMDGATAKVLDHLTDNNSAAGVAMPNLKRFMEQGVRATLRSTCPPVTPVAWPALMTGVGPGCHGVLDFLRGEEQGADVFFTLYDSRDVRTETVWSIACRNRQTAAVCNFIMTAPPPYDQNQALGRLKIVPGFVPARWLRRNTHPKELYDRLKEIDGFNPNELAWDFELESKAMDAQNQDELERWLAYHLRREEQWFRVAEKILIEDDPDLMAVVFDGTDKIQHQAWVFLDPELSPAVLNSAWAKRMQQMCRQYFVNLDSYIGRLVSLAGSQAQVFWASDHGFCGSREVVRINTFLHEKGYLAWRKGDGSAADQRRQRSWFADLDWRQTFAYCRTMSSNGITIRVAKNPGDTGIPPDQYEVFRERLIADLRGFRDDKGSPIISEIHKREEIFRGSAMKDAPDLTLVLRDFGFVSIANVRPAIEKRPLCGTHDPYGSHDRVWTRYRARTPSGNA